MLVLFSNVCRRFISLAYTLVMSVLTEVANYKRVHKVQKINIFSLD